MPLYDFALLGAAQGLILVLVLLTSRYGNGRANRMLAAFIAVLSLRLLVISLEYRSNLAPAEHGPVFLFLHLSYTIGPLLYAYSRLLVEPAWRVRPRHAWHLLPVPIATLVLHPSGPLLDIDPSQHLSFAALPDQSRQLISLLTLPVFVSLGAYSAACLRLLGTYRRRAREQFSALDRINLHWLGALAWSCLGIAIVSGMGEAASAFLGLEPGPRAVYSVLFSVVLIYYIGLMGLRQPRIFDQRPAGGDTAATANEAPPPFGKTDNSAALETALEKPKYQHSGLDDDRLDALWAKVQSTMSSQRPYLQQGLKLAELASIVGTRPNYLSQAINTRAGETFFDYINRHRVAYASELLTEQEDRTIADIALEAGFTSQNLFNSHFKKLTGITPTQYRKNRHPRATTGP